ncbi:hypothetical protein N7490_004116 [Penicillium lividum]|nr:hypothetical protein N7490_004116 [Penicillium lividum]
MDVTGGNFAALLPWILHQISCSCFVAIDLEFSGIAIVPTSKASRDQSLQERYLEVKAAAEKYQILQIGLTVCQENTTNGLYTVSPFVDRVLDVNRDWTFMSWSMEFLMNHQFSMESLCKYGVRYLSREEETQCMIIAHQRWSITNTISELTVKETDQETINFLRATRQVIDWWVAQSEDKRADYLNIPSHVYPRSKAGPPFPRILNNMEKRLVHHLVTAEYPKLKSRSRPMFVQIEFADPVKDKDANKGKANALKTTIRRHVGCRWLIEALVGGDLSELPDETFSIFVLRDGSSPYGAADLAKIIRKRLQENRPVLIGHNCFMDLAFLYSGFIGQLPDTVEEFQKLIHGVLPNVIDTKYLATHDAGSINPASSLEEVARRLVNVSKPTIVIDDQAVRYTVRKSSHEAGYDSMLSAIIFMKMSVQLQKGQIQYCKPADLEGMKICVAKEPSQICQMEHQFKEEQAKETKAGISSIETDLIEFSDDESSPPKRRSALDESGSEAVAKKVQGGQLVPRLDSKFWRVYGNKLRVFGTTERIMNLS